MPGFDGTGPGGSGPATGGGRGFCTGVMTGARPANAGRGFFCRGGGFGRRNRFCATGLTGWERAGVEQPLRKAGSSGRDEVINLKEEAVNLEEQLKSLNERINALEKGR